MNRTRILVLVVAVGVILASCGSDEDDTGTTATSAAPPADVTTQPAADEPATTQADTPAPNLAGTSWSATFYSMENGSLTNVLSSTEVTISFGADGTISGSTGCNEYSGSWEVQGPYDQFEEGVRDDNDGQAIQINSISATERACEGAFVMEQEADHIRNLQGAERWFVARGKLVLRGEGAYIEAEQTG